MGPGYQELLCFGVLIDLLKLTFCGFDACRFRTFMFFDVHDSQILHAIVLMIPMLGKQYRCCYGLALLFTLLFM